MELNRLTTILLDIFDDQFAIGRLTLMAQAEALLDSQLQGLGRAVLRGGGAVAHASAEAHAKSEYKAFDSVRRERRVADAQQAIAAISAEERKLPKARKKKGTPQDE